MFFTKKPPLFYNLLESSESHVSTHYSDPIIFIKTYETKQIKKKTE